MFPDVWKQFINLECEDNIAHDKFNPFGRTLHEIDEEIKWANAQMSIFDYMELEE